MPNNNKYQIPSTAKWKIPGDVPGRSQLYIAGPDEDDHSNLNEEKKNTIRTIASDFYKNQLVKSLSEQSQNISQRTKALTKNTKRTILQPLAILFIIVAGMMLSFSEFNNQFTLKGNESFASVNIPPFSNDKKIASALKINTLQKEIVVKKIENNHQQPRLIKLTNKSLNESKIITHIVVKGDTLWDIAEHYVKDPFHYPELAKLSEIVNPDLIYPGNVIQIQT